jgi:hypothetical protein
MMDARMPRTTLGKRIVLAFLGKWPQANRFGIVVVIVVVVLTTFSLLGRRRHLDTPKRLVPDKARRRLDRPASRWRTTKVDIAARRCTLCHLP